MKTSLFDFELPQELIATQPISPRDASRMLVVKEGEITDNYISNIVDFLNPGDVIVFNDTKVIPARLSGKRRDAKIEVTLHKELDKNLWRVFAKPAKRLKIGDVIDFGADFSAIVENKLETGEVDLHFKCDNLFKCLDIYGKMPLPPYMKRQAHNTDANNYQTVYASRAGAVAAPTAGLHFSDNLLKSLKNKDIKQVYVTLHVGGGTFLPVKSDDTTEHKMHSEYIEISQENAYIINQAKQNGNRIIAVGTTSLRVLESASNAQGILNQFSGQTDIFITPGYKFKIVDILLTNFHLPRSTLFMLVSAFCGLEQMQAAYKHAINNKYRFYSYGDACLLYNN